MAQKEQRFIKVMEDSGFISSNEVLVDTQTGVQYLYHAVGNSGGLTLPRQCPFPPTPRASPCCTARRRTHRNSE